MLFYRKVLRSLDKLRLVDDFTDIVEALLVAGGEVSTNEAERGVEEAKLISTARQVTVLESTS